MPHYTAHYTKTIRGLFLQEHIALDELSPEHKNLLRKFFDLYSQNVADVAFNVLIQSPANMQALGCKFHSGRYWWTKAITDLPIYKILEDMNFVLSIRQGVMAHEDTSYMEQNERTLKEFLQ